VTRLEDGGVEGTDLVVPGAALPGSAASGHVLPARGRLVFALDYPTLDEARRGAELVRDSVGILKVGLELFVREGPPAALLGPALDCEVFLDLKLCDIPETVERAVSSAAALGVRYLTVHAAGGMKMLEKAAKCAERGGIVLLGVTVLTSLDASDLTALGIAAQPREHALRLARLAWSCGVRGFVCSPLEVGALRQALGEDAVLVTPGIRPGAPGGDDQKRTATPECAIRAGATLLVVGRPIRDAPDPAQAARSIVREIALAGSEASTVIGSGR
jgi:orotidine-5'-phosphate decarboxylase